MQMSVGGVQVNDQYQDHLFIRRKCEVKFNQQNKKNPTTYSAVSTWLRLIFHLMFYIYEIKKTRNTVLSLHHTGALLSQCRLHDEVRPNHLDLYKQRF